jgi:hypothetical protein
MTNNQRGVITAMPNELSLGFTRWTDISSLFLGVSDACCLQDGISRRRLGRAGENRGGSDLKRETERGGQRTRKRSSVSRCREAGQIVGTGAGSAEAKARDPVADGEQGCETLPAQMGEQEHQAYEREEGKQIGLEILTLGKVVQCAIAL